MFLRSDRERESIRQFFAAVLSAPTASDTGVSPRGKRALEKVELAAEPSRRAAAATIAIAGMAPVTTPDLVLTSTQGCASLPPQTIVPVIIPAPPSMKNALTKTKAPMWVGIGADCSLPIDRRFLRK